MSQPINALLDDRPGAGAANAVGAPEPGPEVSRRPIELTICQDIDAIEAEWRAFEQQADATAFQSFDWLSLWYRHVGQPAGVRPAIVLGRSAGELVLLLPLAVKPGLVRTLTFLGEDLCDYNAPLMAPGLSAQLDAVHVAALWNDIRARLRELPQLGHDLVQLTKMPETIGAQPNPFLHLEVALNPSGAYLTQLAGTWDEFYSAKRSSATRRRDRTKRKRLAEQGEVRFVTPQDADEGTRTVQTLIAQKTKAFARMGVPNLFARPGYTAFFLDLATNPRTRHLVHVSRLDVGPIFAAINLGLTFHGSYYHVLASYEDGEVARFGPGAAHLRDLLQYAIEKGCNRFDFTIGDERYKLEWSDTVVKLYDHIAAATPRGWLAVVPSLVFRRVRRLIKQNPVLWAAFSAMRGALGSLRGKKRVRETDGAEDAEQNKSPPLAPH
jgi:CelD/BcsL family acetyltransferase involved in cellulose biosynthesis